MTLISMNIKNTDTVRLTRELAGATGETMTTALTVAVRERLERIRRGQVDLDGRMARLRALTADAAGRWVEPYRSADHGDLLYDDRGLPR